MMNRHTEALIIGGGVIGVACAYYLAKSGRAVRVVEKSRVGSGASSGNCGLISPSHVLPLAMPGVVAQALGWMRRQDAPLYIQPRFDPVLFLWLIKFARRCNERDVIESLRARRALLVRSRALYDELFRDERFDCEWESAGSLSACLTEQEMEDFRIRNEWLKQFGVEAQSYTGRALAEKEPALRADVCGAWHYDVDAHLRPDRLLAEWRRVIEEKGAVIEENCEVLRFDVGPGRVRAVETTGGTFGADEFVLATGAWTSKLARRLGLKTPIQPGKGYSVTMKRPGICPRIPCFYQEKKVLATPWPGSIRLGGTIEFSGYNADLNPVRIRALRRAAAEFLREAPAEPVEDPWCGWRPMTPDSTPIIGRSPRHSNLTVAAGHNMQGLSMAPATGMLVAELLCGREPHLDLSPYSLSRFTRAAGSSKKG